MQKHMIRRTYFNEILKRCQEGRSSLRSREACLFCFIKEESVLKELHMKSPGCGNEVRRGGKWE